MHDKGYPCVSSHGTWAYLNSHKHLNSYAVLCPDLYISSGSISTWPWWTCFLWFSLVFSQNNPPIPSLIFSHVFLLLADRLALTEAFSDTFLKLRALTIITTELNCDATVTRIQVSPVSLSGYVPHAISKNGWKIEMSFIDRLFNAI